MYKIFNTYVLRTPLFPLNFFLDLTENKEICDDQLKGIFQNPLVKESIYLASPTLFQEIKKWVENKKSTDIEKIKISFLKYLSRMSSRPTPFGLFSGCSIGKFGNHCSNIERTNLLNKRHTRLDMDLTGIIAKRIEKNPSIKEQLLFYPNNSLYKIGYLLRFVESTYNKNNKLIHKVVEVEASEYLESTIKFSKNGKTIVDLINSLLEPEISIDEAREFVLELIDSQILTSELQQTVCGTENLENIISCLKKLKNANHILLTLELIKNKLTNLDCNVQNDVSLYHEILELLAHMEIEINPKYVFQTDLVIGNNHNTLNKEFISHLEDGLRIINNINSLKKTNLNSDLNKFKEAFYERYETQEVPLSLVLDKELGLGYPVNMGTGDVNPLIDNLNILNVSGKESDEISLSSFERILLNKIIEAKKNKRISIEIKDDEVPTNGSLEDLTDTFSTLAQIVNIENENFIYLNFFSGSSAGNLIGRFCNGDEKMNEYINEITEIEKNINSDKILAEIVHLPEDRLGNVLMRPSIRNFEIPYLARSTKANKYQITVSDLVISIQNNSVSLRSKKHNKEVIPRLTTAHYFKSSTHPIYRFLCDLQGENKRTMLRFGWDSLSNFSDFFPRITYKKVVISTAKWKMNIKDIEYLYKIDNKQILLDEIYKFRNKKLIPALVYFVEGDNKILLNLKNISSIQILFNLVKHKSNFLLEECLFFKDTICTNSEKENYVNEFIFSFYKNKI